MLYKVTPMMAPAEEAKPKKARREPGQPRKRRKTAIYDGEGHEVLITLMCLKCKGMKPLAQFGLRKMADGAIRNQPWCRGCRSQAGTKPKKTDELEVTSGEHAVEVEASVPVTTETEAPVIQAEADAGAPLSTEAVADETTQPMASASTEPTVDGTPLPAAAEPTPHYGG